MRVRGSFDTRGCACPLRPLRPLSLRALCTLRALSALCTLHPLSAPSAPSAPSNRAPTSNPNPNPNPDTNPNQEAAPCSSPSCGCGHPKRKDYTAPPDKLLVERRPEIEAKLEELKERLLLDEKPDGGKLLLSTGEWVYQLSGHRDASFFQNLPPAKTRVVVVQGLCPLREQTLLDGDATLSGAHTAAWARAHGVPVIYTNTAIACQRESDKDGVEKTGAQAGCVDPTGERLKVLALVKQLLYLCLRAADLDIIAIVASSNASARSFANLATHNHFVQQQGEGIYEGVPLYRTPHLKFVSPTVAFTVGVALTLGVPLGDRLAVPTAVCAGWARIGAELQQLALGCEPLAGVALEEATQQVYETMLADPTSPGMARPWSERNTTTTSPELQAKLEAVLAEQGNYATLTLTLTLTRP